MKLKLTLITLTVFLLGVIHAKAQANTVTYTPSHLSAAEQLMNTTGTTDFRYSAMRESTIKSLSSSVPEKNRAQFVKEMIAFFDKYLPLNKFRDQTIKIYADAFSEDELKQLISFYNSELGKKITSKLPELMQNMMITDQGIINEHRDELIAIVTEATKE